MNNYLKDISLGISVGDPPIFIQWGTNKNEILENLRKIGILEAGGNHCIVKVNLFNDFESYPLFMFDNMKLSKIILLREEGIRDGYHLYDHESYHKNPEDIRIAFLERQASLERYFGRPSLQSPIISYFARANKGDKKYKWRFRNITIVHSMWDRFGMEEEVTIHIK